MQLAANGAANASSKKDACWNYGKCHCQSFLAIIKIKTPGDQINQQQQAITR